MTGPVQRAGGGSPERSMSQITCVSCGSTAVAGLPFCPACGKKLTTPTVGRSCPLARDLGVTLDAVLARVILEGVRSKAGCGGGGWNAAGLFRFLEESQAQCAADQESGVECRSWGKHVLQA